MLLNYAVFDHPLKYQNKINANILVGKRYLIEVLLTILYSKNLQFKPCFFLIYLQEFCMIRTPSKYDPSIVITFDDESFS
jgi:hypothetical protein